MGACCVMMLMPSGRLPKNAQPASDSDPDVAALLEGLQGDWKIVPMGGDMPAETGYRRNIAFQQVNVNNKQYTLSGGPNGRVQVYSFKFYRANGQLYCDEWGSIVVKTDWDNGEVILNNGFNMDLKWKRPDSWYIQRNGNQFNQNQNLPPSGGPPVYSSPGDAPPAYSSAPPAYTSAPQAPIYTPPQGSTASGSTGGGSDMAEQIAKLADLRDKCIITDEEFTVAKNKIINES